MRLGATDELIHNACRIDPWFLAQMREHRRDGSRDHGQGPADDRRRVPPAQGDGLFRRAARQADRQRRRRGDGEAPQRSTCGRCSSASTPAPPNSPRRPPTCIRPTRRRSPAQSANEAAPSDKKKVVILGGGPNRIGQGIEFDYCCCHACLRAEGGRLRNHHDQLQSGDGVDRLRHLRPALFRAADRRRRAGDHRHRAHATARCTA